MGSFNDTVDRYRVLLHAQQEDRLQLPNDNLDTGAITMAADYRLADAVYAELLKRLSGKSVSNALKQDILSAHEGFGYAETDASV
jgi:hypothetical protein